MKSKPDPPLSSQIPSVTAVWLFAVACGVAVFFIAICLQWLIYDDWLHKSGPLRLVGSAIAFFLTLVFAYRWQLAARKRKIETLRRFETIRWMNDRIRNSLQAIECLVYATNPHVTDPVKDAVDIIENVLQEVLSEAHPEPADQINELQESSSASSS
ncbi:MAG: hypothetical protein WB561_07185 [Terracidiphilus sp.]